MPRTSRVKRHHTRLYYDLMLLRRAISLDIANASFGKVYRRIQKLSKKQIQDVVSICMRILKDPRIGWKRNRGILLSATQTIVAAAPHSARTIEQLIENKSRRADYEIHFSLFCFIDALIEFKISRKLRRQMLSCLGGYLLNIERDNAFATWKVGESLGWHWPVEEALPVLMELAKEAKYVAGRESALDGLGYVLASASLSPACRKQILSLFEDTITNDRSHAIKEHAIFVLDLQAKGRKQIDRLLRSIARNSKDEQIRDRAEFALEKPIAVLGRRRQVPQSN